MAIHDYRCPQCEHTMTDQLKPPEECEQCHHKDPERLFPTSPPTPYFKAGGFYITDYTGRNTPKDKT